MTVDISQKLGLELWLPTTCNAYGTLRMHTVYNINQQRSEGQRKNEVLEYLESVNCKIYTP